MATEAFAIYDGSTVSASGSVTLNGTVNVVGTTTAFLTQLALGDVIEVNGEARVVVDIDDNTHLAVSTAFSQTASGQDYTIYPLAYVEDLAPDLLAPASDAPGISQPTPLADGTVRGLGWLVAAWRWGWVTQAQRNALKALCPGVSVETFIRTRADDGTFKTYRAVMVWPPREDYYAAHLIGFALTFRRLEVL